MSKISYMRSADGTVFTTSFPEYHKDCEKLTLKAGKIARQEYCLNVLRKAITPKQTIYCILRNVSSSGMSRRISFTITNNDDVTNLDTLIADALGYKMSDKGGLIVSGCGMDMGFHVVSNLGRALWPNGTPEPHGMRNGEPDSNGEYALKHSWL